MKKIEPLPNNRWLYFIDDVGNVDMGEVIHDGTGSHVVVMITPYGIVHIEKRNTSASALELLQTVARRIFRTYLVAKSHVDQYMDYIEDVLVKDAASTAPAEPGTAPAEPSSRPACEPDAC